MAGTHHAYVGPAGDGHVVCAGRLGSFTGCVALLGMAEAGFFPGILYYLTQWFPRPAHDDQPLLHFAAVERRFFMGAVAVRCSICKACLVCGWQWLLFWSRDCPRPSQRVFLEISPETPRDAHQLNDAGARLIEGQLAAEGSVVPSSHATMPARRLRTRGLQLFGLTNLLMLGVNYAYTFPLPAMVQNLTHLNVTLVGYIIRMGLLGAVGMRFNAWFSDRTGRSYLHIALCLRFWRLGAWLRWRLLPIRGLRCRARW